MSILSHRLVRYIISGGTAAGVNLSVLFVLVHFLSVHYLPASVVSFFASLIISFTMQKVWTFQDSSTRGMHVQFGQYVAITFGVNLGLNTLLMYLFVTVLGIWYLAAQVVIAGILAVLSYMLYSTVVFSVASVQSAQDSSQSVV